MYDHSYVVVSAHQPPLLIVVFFLMIRRPPRSTLDRSSAASDVYKRQDKPCLFWLDAHYSGGITAHGAEMTPIFDEIRHIPVSYTHLRAHETVLDLVCRLLLVKKTKTAFESTIIRLILRHYVLTTCTTTSNT